VTVAPGALLRELSERFGAWLDRWRQGDLGGIRAAWEERAHPIGTPLRVRLPDGEARSGRFGGLDADGALRLIGDDNRAVVVHVGDVSA